MIEELIVRKLNGKHDLHFNFNPDLNLFTGKNGCGKTTILKLMWYLTSGNIGQLFKEINFEYVFFKSTNTEAKLQIDIKDEEKYITGYYKSKVRDISFKETLFQTIENNPLLKVLSKEKSLFFPTFRIIEGGFTLGEDERFSVGGRGLNAALAELADELTLDRNNRFIASISTHDIIQLLNEKYTEILEKVRRLESEQSTVILEQIRTPKHESDILNQIANLVNKTDLEKDELMKPFTVLSKLIQEIFFDKSIEINRSLTLGEEAKDAITSDKLSAGEKQMLSFLCYSFFSDNTSIFIDEPELSLHTDWQRILFPTLLEQSTNNQFFVATHSPFIYSQYPDKEHILDIDKGGIA